MYYPRIRNVFARIRNVFPVHTQFILPCIRNVFFVHARCIFARMQRGLRCIRARMQRAFIARARRAYATQGALRFLMPDLNMMVMELHKDIT